MIFFFQSAGNSMYTVKINSKINSKDQAILDFMQKNQAIWRGEKILG